MYRSHQYRKILWRKCSHTGTKMHTHVLIQSDLDLGLTLHHHPWQQHWKLPLNKTLSETGENGLVQWKPAKRVTLHSYSTFSFVNSPLMTVKIVTWEFPLGTGCQCAKAAVLPLVGKGADSGRWPAGDTGGAYVQDLILWTNKKTISILGTCLDMVPTFFFLNWVLNLRRSFWRTISAKDLKGNSWSKTASIGTRAAAFSSSDRADVRVGAPIQGGNLLKNDKRTFWVFF